MVQGLKEKSRKIEETMSYAEHGSKIFLTGKIHSEPLSRYVVTKKRSEGRLKLFDSCTDLRAWSPHPLDNCRHFREIIENRTPSGRIVPHDVLFENLIILGKTELASVRRQLEKYKALRLTPEQKRQLRENNYYIGDRRETSDSTVSKETRIVEDESGIPKRPGTPTQSICSSLTNFHDIEIDNDFSTDNNSERSREVSDTSEIYEDVDESNDKSRRDDRTKSSGSYKSDDNHGIIIKKDSEIISLNHELAAKNADLDETREIYKNVERSLKEKEQMLDNFRRNFKISQEKLQGIGEEKEELKKKLYDSKCLVDHLRSNLAEKSQKCFSHIQEIQELGKRVQATEQMLRKEKESLSRKMEEMKIVLCERNDLIKLNKEQAISLADQEDEINRLLAFIKEKLSRYNEQETRMKSEINDLRSELDATNGTISQFETHQVTVRTNISPTGSLSKVQTSEIRKFKIALQEDLQAVEEELSRRRDIYKNDDLNNARDKTQQDDLQYDEYHEISKDFMGCTIEQLTVQVSSSKVANIEQAAIDEKIFSDFTHSEEAIRRLVLQLEPYVEERVALVDEIECLKEALDHTQRDFDSRDTKMQKKYQSEVKNHRKECEGYSRRIAHLEKLLNEKNRWENVNEMDEEIDKALAIHVKRSIERMTKLSVGLRGAGDEMTIIRDKVEIRDAEIARLREQVNLHVSRGQGDEANNENLKEIGKLKSEKKRLIEELKNHEVSLKLTRDRLQSREFELKGLKRQKNDLLAQYKGEIKKKNKEIEELVREKEGLDKTVLMMNDYVMDIDTMRVKLESLHNENSKLIDENTEIIKRCEDYKNRLNDLSDRENQMKDTFDQTEFKLQEQIARNEIEMENLRANNETLGKLSKKYETDMRKLIKELEELREYKKEFDQMEKVWEEISIFNEDKQILVDKLTRLRYNLENHYRTNSKLGDHLKWQINENEILQNAIEELNDNIRRISNAEMSEETTKNLLRTLPEKICQHIEKLKERFVTSESLGISWQSEINELRAKSLADESKIEKLHEEIKSWKNKLAVQEKRIIGLEETNANLREKLAKYETNEKIIDAEEKARFEDEIKMKELKIVRLAEDIETKNNILMELDERLKLLTNENNEMRNELKSEKELREMQLSDMQQKHAARMKVFNDRHNDSIKKLLTQQEESMKNIGNNPFDSESWLKSLTMKEMLELHKRISVSSPCESISETSKTRALNDKQNQQLQQDENLHADMIHIKNGHLKDQTFGFPYMYERRKFEGGNKNKSVETSFNNNSFDTQRKNFFHQCAIKHKYDISH